MSETPPHEPIDTLLFWRIGEWGRVTFPHATDASVLKHLDKELAELHERPDNGEEMADVVMLVAHLAYRHGYDLLAEVARKFAICKTRKWGEPDADGVVEHIRDEAATEPMR